MAHTLLTLMAHSDKSVAANARRLWTAAGKPKQVREAFRVYEGTYRLTGPFAPKTLRGEYTALRYYAQRMMLAPTTPKIGAIVVNGAACFVPQRGEHLSVSMAQIACSRACGNGAFRT